MKKIFPQAEVIVGDSVKVIPSDVPQAWYDGQVIDDYEDGTYCVEDNDGDLHTVTKEEILAGKE